MSRFFYAKLALNNIKKNAQTYIPYMLTCTGTILMYYIIRGLSMNESMLKMQGGDYMIVIMGLGSWIIGIFAVIFLFYTNSFLIKRRKKEFGLFNILGMEKRHLARVVLWESLYAFLISMAAGLAAGVILSKLAYMGIEKLLQMDIIIQFQISPKAMVEALILFGVIFTLNLLNTLRQIHLANPVELLKGGNVGEKEPKTKWIMTIIGLICIGIGYYIAATVVSPLEAIFLFFLAVILVIIATYCLFTAGSIAILKLLRRNKKFYYKADHFVAISGMMYRMKQNAAGLASICVLSTGVLILISTTICMYLGTEDAIKRQYPRNFSVEVQEAGAEVPDKMKVIMEHSLEGVDTQPENILGYYNLSYMLFQDGSKFSGTGKYMNSMDGIDTSNIAGINCITLEEYNRMQGTNATLQDGEVLLYEEEGKLEGDSITIGNTTFKIKEKVESLDVPESTNSILLNSYYLILPNKDTVNQIAAGMEKADGIDEEDLTRWSYFYGFDVDENVDKDTQLKIFDKFTEEYLASGLHGYTRCTAEGRISFYSMTGGLFFLGIFLGILFLMGTVLIIYYKQISEGYDDRDRYQIMKKVGMSKREVRKSIRSQVLTVFYLPLIAAGVHILFAFNIISRMLSAIQLYNIPLFILCTAGTLIVFAALYTVVYAMTAKSYYKIIS